jgi:surfactin synthase thioesterase subunit
VDPAAAARWAEVTTGAFHHEVLPGGHFYLTPGKVAVTELVAARLRASGGHRTGGE